MVHSSIKKVAMRSMPRFYERVGFYLGQGFNRKEAVRRTEQEMM